MFDIDAAVLRNQRDNPPPPWWPLPPAGIPISRYFPIIGTARGEQFAELASDPDDGRDEYQAPPRAEGGGLIFTNQDILAATYPGDSIRAIERRIGVSDGYVRDRRRRNRELAEQMDARRGVLQ